MEAALHGDDGFAAEASEDEVAAVSLDGRDGEIGYLGIGDEELVVDMVYQRPETGAEDYGYLGHLALYARAEILGGLIDLFKHGD